MVALAACGGGSEDAPRQEGAAGGNVAGASGTGGAAGAAGTAGAGAAGAAQGGQAGSGPEVLPLPYYTCPAEGGLSFECAKVQVPLDHADPTGKTITLFVRKAAAKQQPARGRLWVLQGGPGVSTTQTLPATAFTTMAPDLDVCLVDHRGTGSSTPLSCPDAEALLGKQTDPATNAAVLSACGATLEAQWGKPGLAQFSSEAAGKDLGLLIARDHKVAGAPKDAFVYGVSYGTRWAMRYLRAYPDQASAVILDGVVKEGTDIARFAENAEAVAKKVFDACSADAFCSSKLPGGWAKLEALNAKLLAGHCPTSLGLDRGRYRTLFQNVLAARAALLPALVYRVDRCADADRLLIEKTRKMLPTAPTGLSLGLYMNVLLSEMLPNGPDGEAKLTQLDASLLAASPDDARMIADVYPSWPRYTPTPGYPTTSVPVLLVDGTFDAQTVLPDALEAKPAFSGPAQTFFTVPYGPHGAALGEPCAHAVATQFLAAPTAALDLSCASGAKVDFENAGIGLWFAKGDTWENP